MAFSVTLLSLKVSLGLRVLKQKRSPLTFRLSEQKCTYFLSDTTSTYKNIRLFIYFLFWGRWRAGSTPTCGLSLLIWTGYSQCLPHSCNPAPPSQPWDRFSSAGFCKGSLVSWIPCLPVSWFTPLLWLRRSFSSWSHKGGLGK